VQQWPGSYCDSNQGCCFPISGPPKAVFGIHGLWPNNDDGSYPSNCGSDPFDPSQIQAILKSMNADWGSLACPSSNSDSFWTHEWTKHGTCSGMNEHDYFQSAISLYGTYDITGALKKAGIVPDGSQYDVNHMADAMSKVLHGHLPGVECNSDQQGNQQIYQVYICVDTDGSTLIDCPVFPSDECTGTVAFTVFNPKSGGAV
jgi:ribonuclease T2